MVKSDSTINTTVNLTKSSLRVSSQIQNLLDLNYTMLLFIILHFTVSSLAKLSLRFHPLEIYWIDTIAIVTAKNAKSFNIKALQRQLIVHNKTRNVH